MPIAVEIDDWSFEIAQSALKQNFRILTHFILGVSSREPYGYKAKFQHYKLHNQLPNFLKTL
jgi:hypothetical protein